MRSYLALTPAVVIVSVRLIPDDLPNTAGISGMLFGGRVIHETGIPMRFVFGILLIVGGAGKEFSKYSRQVMDDSYN